MQNDTGSTQPLLLILAQAVDTISIRPALQKGS